MKGLLITALAAIAGVASAENVVTLGDANFDAHIATAKFHLVEFMAPWCGHCKNLKEPYEEVATHFKTVDVEGGLSFVAVDATEAKDLAAKYGVQGFPTLKWFVDGQDMEYTGGRSKEEFISWVNKKTGPPAVDIADDAALASFKESSDVVVFGYFSDLTSEAAKKFLAVAATSDDAPFGISSTVSAGLSADSVAVFRTFEDEDPEVKCKSLDELKECVSSNLLPLVVPFTQSSAPKIFGGDIKQHVLVFMDKNADYKKSIESFMRPIASVWKGKFLFVTVDKSDDRIIEFFSISESDFPTARIVDMAESGMKKFALTEALTEASLAAFVKSFDEGALAQDLKSEADIPDEDQPKDGSVWVLVGVNHDRITGMQDKNVLVEYYAPWCGHCKKLAPEYEKLGAHFKDDDKVIIAKMDSTANEVARVSVTGFPTLKFFPAGSDEIVDFSGERDEENMRKFIDEQRK